MRISPILTVDGLLTLVTLAILPAQLREPSNQLLSYFALIWLGLASVHITGWLALVLKVSFLKEWLTKNNLIKLYDRQGFLWVYLVVTVSLLIAVLA
jgi:hypothetical protein